MANRTRRFGDSLANHPKLAVSQQPQKTFAIPDAGSFDDQENRVLCQIARKDENAKFQVFCDENEPPTSKDGKSSECHEQMLVDNMEACEKHLNTILIGSSEASDKENIQDESMCIDDSAPNLLTNQSSVLNDSSAYDSSEASLLQICMEPNAFYEFADSIRLYMLEKERSFLADPHYMNQQININSRMRSILIDWMVDVADEYKMNDETLFLAINYIDRFLSKVSITRQEFQLLGTSALFIASKYEEIYPPALKDFVYVTDEYYTKAQILQSERLVLTVLEFNVSAPTCNYFLEKIIFDADISREAYCLAKYICFLTALECSPFLKYYPSEIALASVMVACKCLGLKNVLSEEYLEQTLEYEQSLGDAGDVSQMLFDRNVLIDQLESLLRLAKTHSQQAIQRKFSTLKYCSVSTLDF